MAVNNPRVPLSGLARRLILDKLITQADAEQASEQSLKARKPFVSYLVEKKILGGDKIAWSAAQEFGVPLMDINALELDKDIVSLVEEKLVRQHRALPLFKRGNRLFVGLSDPTNLQALDEIKFHARLSTEAILVQDDKLGVVIDKAMEASETSMDDLLDEDLDDLELEADDEPRTPDVSGGAEDEAPIVKFVNKILTDGIKKGASDLHFEPYEKDYRIRFRQDGMLNEVASPPANLAIRITARIKVMARLDIAERRVPQDGRIKLKLSKNKSIDFRVSTCPTLFGEKVVMRILDPAAASMGIDSLGYEDIQKKRYVTALHNPYGMILVTGPTGSGKTVSLYTGLNLINTPGVNISTAEDPVEINVRGINQVNVNPKTGLTFAATLRSFLRQDPDVIMVGEIRDLETAEIAVKAAQTGHMVLSTLHTNDGPQTLTRLANMGVPPFNIASSVNLIIAQRLARRLCPKCKQEEKIPPEAMLKEGFTEEDVNKNITLMGKGPGCDACGDKGYRGRLGIYQVMPISEEMGRIIMGSGTSLELADQAKVEGIADLRTSGLRKALQGVTSLEEINRVTKD